MQTTQGSLVIIGANTPECKVFWNGTEVQHVGISADNSAGINRVVLKVAEDTILAEMQAAGIIIRRV